MAKDQAGEETGTGCFVVFVDLGVIESVMKIEGGSSGAGSEEDEGKAFEVREGRWIRV